MPDQSNTIKRPPVVAIMGHVDHGKSTLLDYIQKTNVVDGEAGGITQHLSAYEITIPSESGDDRKITFIDTPGHAAFQHMRQRGANTADIAILIVAADDGVKAQTIEAIQTIQTNHVPFVVAFNKIDKPGANIIQAKTQLAENGVYVEGFGGDVPFAEISAKSGDGVDDLLETLLLVADLEELTGDPTIPASGFVIESHLDERRGISATLIIKNGSIQVGQTVVVQNSLAKVRILEDFSGKAIKEAQFSSPIKLVGFDSSPMAGSTFQVYESKKDAEKAAAAFTPDHATLINQNINAEVVIPLVIKTDVGGTMDAIIGEIANLNNDRVAFKVIKTGVGTINESDVQIAAADENSLIIGFNVDVDKKVLDTNDTQDLTIKTFSIIYKLTEWLQEIQETSKLEKQEEVTVAEVKVLKVFSSNKNKHVLGARVTDGTLHLKADCRVERRGEVVGRCKITNLEQAKQTVEKIESGNEFGGMFESKFDFAEGDIIRSIEMRTV